MDRLFVQSSDNNQCIITWSILSAETGPFRDDIVCFISDIRFDDNEALAKVYKASLNPLFIPCNAIPTAIFPLAFILRSRFEIYYRRLPALAIQQLNVQRNVKVNCTISFENEKYHSCTVLLSVVLWLGSYSVVSR